MRVLSCVVVLAVCAAAADEPVMKLQGLKGEVEGLAFSADGKLLAAAGQDGAILI